MTDSSALKGSQDDVCILLAVHNGGAYLKQQLESINAQSLKNWILYVSDDASSDNSLELVKSTIAPSQLRIVNVSEVVLGSKDNFALLMTYALESNAGYFAFADQDDIWPENRLDIMRNKIKENESLLPNIPLLVYGDMEVIDEYGRQIHVSFMRLQGLSHEAEKPLTVLLAQNYISGCSSMINRALLEIATPVPHAAILHDWWVALCAAASGKIIFTEGSLNLYRQHQNNAVGAVEPLKVLRKGVLGVRNQLLQGNRNLANSFEQAKALHNRLILLSCNASGLNYIKQYSLLSSVGRLQRWMAYRELKVHAQSRYRQVLQCARIILY